MMPDSFYKHNTQKINRLFQLQMHNKIWSILDKKNIKRLNATDFVILLLFAGHQEEVKQFVLRLIAIPGNFLKIMKKSKIFSFPARIRQKLHC